MKQTVISLILVVCLTVGLMGEDVHAQGNGTMYTPDEIMAMRPFTPLDTQLLSYNSYPDTFRTGPPWTGNAPTDEEVREVLEDYLLTEFPDDPERHAAGLALYDDPVALEKLPDPVLRAALVGLMGTVGEPAIDHILYAVQDNGHPLFIGAYGMELDANVPAQVIVNLDTGENHIQFNTRYWEEHPFLLTSLLAHEAGHSNTGRGAYEEATLKVVETLVYLQQLVRHPELAQSGTELSRLLNTQALLLLNSGLGSSIGIYTTNGELPALPGSNKNYTGVWDLYLAMTAAGLEGGDMVSTPGSALLDGYLAAITGRSVENADYSEETLNLLDSAGNGPLTTQELVVAARALRLDVPPCEQTIGCEPIPEVVIEIDCTLTADSNVNLRGGPGTDHPETGTLGAGQSLSADALTFGLEDGYGWYRIDEDRWVRWDVIQASGGCRRLPIVAPE
jgi:hypothetical protein